MKTMAIVFTSLSIFCFLTAMVVAQPEPRSPDTRELGLIRRGMSTTEVLDRLGIPERTELNGYRSYTIHRRGREISIVTIIERWLYPGSYSNSGAEIVFENGKVIRAARL